MTAVNGQHNYRKSELKKIETALLACESLLITGETGIGKTFFSQQLCKRLQQSNYPFVNVYRGTVKQTMTGIMERLSLDLETIEGKKKTIYLMMDDIIQYCSINQTIFICDDAHRQTPTIRLWIERLIYDANCPVLLLATNPPARDIFLKLPRIELKPLKDKEIREIMKEYAIALGLTLNNAQYAQLQASTGGNPMLAQRVVKEHYLGIEHQGLDHTQWIDGTPYLMAFLMCLVVVRFIGLGLNNTSLYLLGGIITTIVGVSRILIYSLPKKSNKL
jgi:Holliday junction resolvasome RuvABC ATP-dependent DNA helicase subunit